MKNLTFITTVGHNVGDDFVREGIRYLLSRTMPSLSFKYSSIHKHAPVTARKGWPKSVLPRISNRIDALLPLWSRFDKILDADLVVQCGAPVYWHHQLSAGGIEHCANNEWYEPLIERRYRRVSSRVKLLNIAGGTCQGFDSDGSEIINCPECGSYLDRFYHDCALTTVRDALSEKILRARNKAVRVLPCPSIFARDAAEIEPSSPEYAVLNFMPLGGHYVFDSEIDPDKWLNAFTAFYDRLKSKPGMLPVVFACHNDVEYRAAKKIDSVARIFQPDGDWVALLRFYAKAAFGIFNRVHGAFALASFGRPSFIVGNDSRARMANEIDLECESVMRMDADRLESAWSKLEKSGNEYGALMEKIRRRTEESYIEVLSEELRI